MRSLVIVCIIIAFFFTGCHEYVSQSEDKPVTAYKSAIMIISPDQNQQWKPGESHTIEWKIFGKVDKVNIILLKKKRYNQIVIAEDVSNNSSLEWKIPEDIVPSVSYQVKIENSENPKEYSYSEYFSIR